MDNDKKVMGIEVLITQETNTHTHSLFRVYNTHEVNEVKFKGLVESLKKLAIDFVKGKKGGEM